MSAGIVALILTAVLLPLAVDECRDWCPWLAERLVRWAAHRLGDPHACARYAEEWVANINAVPGKLAPLIAAFGFVITVPRMRWTLRRPLRRIHAGWHAPHDVANFTGRFRQLAALDDVLGASRRDEARPGSGSVAVVTGAAGAGKTALIVRWAHRAKQHFPDGCLYVDLRGDSDAPSSPAEVLGRFLRDLGVPAAHIPSSAAERLALYRNLVADRHMLIVLDNAASETQVRHLLPYNPCGLAIVTSRNTLFGLVARNVYFIPIGGLPLIEAVSLVRAVIGDMLGADPLELITNRNRRTQMINLGLTLDVCDHHRVAGNADDDVLDTIQPMNMIDTVFSLAFLDQHPDRAHTFGLLGLHPGHDFDIYAGAALLGTDVAEAQQRIDDLVQAALLEEAGDGRHRMPELLRSHARGQVIDTREVVQAQQRLFTHYLVVAAAAAELIASCDELHHPMVASPSTCPLPMHDAESAKNWLNSERHNVLIAIKHTGIQPTTAGRLARQTLTDLINGHLDTRG